MIQLALTAHAGSSYHLANAVFRVTGQANATLSADTPTISKELPAGDYLIRLRDGWTLNVVAADGTEQPVDATLLSGNPMAFAIQAQETTHVTFEFEVDGSTIKMGDGVLVVAAKIDDGKIDDFEDGDANVLPIGGRNGGWFSFNDGTSGVQIPPANVLPLPLPDGRNGSLALHTVGSGFTAFGSAVGVAPAALDNLAIAYNASGYKGVRFTYSSTSFNSVRFNVSTTDTADTANGGTCVPGPQTCFDDFGVFLGPSADFSTFPPTPAFTTAEIRWENLAQLGFGTGFQFDPAHVLTIKWQFSAFDNFNFILDDVEFIQ
jgi:hypothetical protein